MQVKKVTIEYDNDVVITGPSLEAIDFLCKQAVENVKVTEEDVFAENMKAVRSPVDGQLYYSDII